MLMFNCSWLFVRVHVPRPRPAVHVTKPLSRFQSNTYLHINMSCSCSATEVDFVGSTREVVVTVKNTKTRLPLLLFHLLTAVSAVKYDDLRPLIAVGITSSVLLAQHFGCSQRWINQAQARGISGRRTCSCPPALAETRRRAAVPVGARRGSQARACLRHQDDGGRAHHGLAPWLSFWTASRG